ncbi:MAG: 30S ribosomal protein S4 [Chloroflexi bacterium]|nr:30S ribosomal protein S4 [Chloroflexota bacterium]MCZ6866359.1 30S ribosomal protein S4 [Chloroflexota bacterium]
MARYTGPACRRCRRVGEKLFLKGERCYTPKCAVDRRRTPPGDRSMRRRRVSDHGIQLREKQKARYMYGIMEAQFSKYVKQAFTQSESTGQNLIKQLETRLDNVAYRLGFADSRRQARQLVLHGHFLVGDRKTDIPSYTVRPGDVISWKESHKDSEYVKIMTADLPKRPVPEWLELDVANLKATVRRLPSEDELETTIDTRLIVEFYSR